MISRFTSTILDELITPIFISAVLTIELQSGLRYSILLGLDHPNDFGEVVLGKTVSILFVVAYIQHIFILLQKHGGRRDEKIIQLEKSLFEKGEQCIRATLSAFVA